MTLAIMQPYIFPYIGYFQLMNCVDKFVLYDDVNYINRGWINRNQLLAQGKPQLFTIPLIGASQNKLINEIDIMDDGKLFSKLLRTIQDLYKKAPFFQSVFPIIEQVLLQKEKNIAGFIYHSILSVNAYLGITTKIERSSSIYGNADLKAQNRILDICMKEKASRYINPIGGMEIYSKPFFDENKISLYFIKSKPVNYKQFGNEFVPWLSIIDVLMFNSVEEIDTLLTQYELVT